MSCGPVTQISSPERAIHLWDEITPISLLAASLPAEVSQGILPWNHCSFLCSLYYYILCKPFVILGSSSKLDWLINHPSLWGCLGLELSPLSVVIYWQMSEHTSVTIYPMSWFSQSRDTRTIETSKWEQCQELTIGSWLKQHPAVINDLEWQYIWVGNFST